MFSIRKIIQRIFPSPPPAPCAPAAGLPYRFKDQAEFMRHYYSHGGDPRGCAYPVVSATWKAARETMVACGGAF